MRCSPVALACSISALLGLPLLSGAKAQTLNWTAASGTDLLWGNIANWDLNVEPSALTDVILPTPIPNPGGLPTAGTITLGAGETANSLTINAAYTLTGGDLTLSTGNPFAGEVTVTSGTGTIISQLIGGGSLTKLGGGTLVIGGGAADSIANTFTGTTTISAGTLRLNKAAGTAALGSNTIVIEGGTLAFGSASPGNNDQLLPTANITMSGGSLSWFNSNQTFASLTATGGAINGGNANGGAVTITGTLSTSGATTFGLNSFGQWSAQTMNLGSSAAVSLGGNSAGRLTTLTTGSGGLNLTSQTIQLNTVANGGGSLGSAVILGGTLTSSGTSAINVSNAYGSRNLDLGGVNRTINVADGTLSVAAIVSNGGLFKTGAGMLTLGGANTFDGGITIDQGTLSISADNHLGATTNGITINGTTLRSTNTGGLALNTGRQITIGNAGATFETVTAAVNFGPGAAVDRLTGSGPITKNGPGTFRVQSDNSTLSSNWTINAGVIESNAANALGTGTVTVNSNGVLAVQNGPYTTNVFLAGGGISSNSSTTTLNGTLTVNDNSSIVVNDWFQDSARDFTLGGKLTGDPTKTLTIRTSRINATNSGNFNLTNTTNDFAGTIVISKNLRVNTAATGGTGKTLGTAPVELQGGLLLLRDDNGGTSDGTMAYGNNVLVSNNAGNGGTIQTPLDGSLGNMSVIDVNRVGTTSTGNRFQLGTLTVGAQTLRVQGGNGYGLEITGATSLTSSIVETTSANVTLSGTISGSGTLAKFGAATLALSGNTAITGHSTLAVNGGAFQLNNELTNNADRIGNSIPVILNNGTLSLRGNAASASTESIGAVTFTGGAGLGASSASGSTNTTLTLASLTRAANNATLTLSASGPNALGSTDKVIVTAGGPALDAVGIVGGWGVNASDLGFLGYNAANGFTNVAFDSTDFASATSTSLVDRSTAQALAANADVHAAKLGSGALTGSAFTLNLRSGGLILNNGSTGVTHSASLSFSPDGGTTRGTAYIYANNTSGSGTVNGGTSAVLSGLISASEIVKSGPGNIRLNNVGQSNNAGLANSVITINDGSVEVGVRTGAGIGNEGRALPSTVSVVLNGGSVNFFDSQALAGLNAAGGSIVRVGSDQSDGTAETLIVNNNTNNFFAGTLTGDSNTGNEILFTKGGDGRFVFAGTMQVQRALTVNRGELVLTNNAGMGPASLTDRQVLVINQGGTLTLDNSVSQADRLGLNAGTANGGGYFRLNGGTLNYRGNANVNSVETFGTTTAIVAGQEPFFGEGMDIIEITPGLDRAAILVSERDIVRRPGATVLFSGPNFGGTRGAANTASFNYNTSGPGLVGGGGGVNTVTRGVMPGQFVHSMLDGDADIYGIATFTGTGTATTGVRRLSASEMAATFANGATAFNNILLTSAVTGIDTATAINSLHLGGAADIQGTGTLTINSGTILSANNDVPPLGGNAISVATLAVDTREATFFTADDLTVSSVITGSAGLTKGGRARLTLSSNNTFDATAAGALGVTVNGGLLSISTDANLGASANAVRLNNEGGIQATASFTTARNFVLGNAGGVIDVANTANTFTLSGSISGNLGTINAAGIASATGSFANRATVLTKTGPGTLLLTGSNAFTGRTVVNEGTLLVGDGTSGSLPANSHVVVLNGTLGGTNGSIGGDVDVFSSSAAVAPGVGTSSTSTLNIGSLTMFSGGKLKLELNGGVAGSGYDQLVVTGSVNLDIETVGTSELVLALGNGFVPGFQQTFTLLANDGEDPIANTFGKINGLAFGPGNTFQLSNNTGTYEFQLFYGGEAGAISGGNDIVLQSIPEPTTATLLGLSVFALLHRRRRKAVKN